MSNAKIGFAFIGILCIVILVGSTFKIVSSGNVGVRITLGKVSPDPVAPGLSWKLPLVTDIEEISIRQGTNEIDAQCFSTDLQQVDCKLKILSRPTAAKVPILYQTQQTDVFNTLVAPRVQEALKEVTASRTAEQIVAEREKIKQTALQSARSKIGELVIIDDLVIENITLSHDLEAAIEAKMVAAQSAEKAKFVQSQAQTDADTAVIKAKGDAQAIQIQGEALAKTPNLIDLKIVEKWDGKSPLVVGESKGTSILLPIDKTAATRGDSR